jgi:indolepyruvate ferredoxin oxidoreductase
MNAPLTPELSSALQTVTLDDKYDLTHGRAWMSGIHALVRLPMNQRIRDLHAGLNTAGFVSGYRGSPLGTLDQNLWKAKQQLQSHHVVFQPGLNEDLAATSVWGSQQVPLFPGAKYDGVFGLWYGKGPGVDRSGDVFKHANAAGTSPHGGVLLAVGDDHPAKSSTLPHQSDHILKACMIPVLFPSSVQEILDFGVVGWGLSRYAGVWVGLKCITDIVEVSASVELDPDRVKLVLPEDFMLPPDGLNIRVPDTPLAQEARLLDYKLYAALAYARANKLNRQIWHIPDAQARFGIITSGKAYLDTCTALLDLGLTPEVCRQIGLRLFKVGMVWPLEASGLQTFAENLDEILVVEEKRQILEYQVKEELFAWIGTGKKIPRVVGKFDDKDGGEWAVPQGNWLLPAHYEFSPSIVATAIGQRLLKFNLPEDVRAGIQARLTLIEANKRALEKPRVVTERKPWFCSGCPHNTSTRLPEGSRGMAGIGCHYMVTWMDRQTQVYTQMGGEGVPWIGQAPFTTEEHIFANIGDGTYYHSGLLAVRAAVAANVNITYKVLFNDAVAMTGGQPVEGHLTVPMVAEQLLAESVNRVVVVTDEPEKYGGGKSAGAHQLPSSVDVIHRDELDAIQRTLREIKGVTALIYDQTCASEKRRRRKRNTYPDPAKRVVINERVCEGCGDCSKQSNCLSVEPLETALGRKRTINQSSCNKDFSCVKGFCPSFVTVHGGQLRKPQVLDTAALQFDAIPQPGLAALTKPYGIVVAGVGGTGVVTIGQLLGMAAHLEGKGASVLDMAGLAQKGGAVFSHVFLAQQSSDIQNTRVAAGDADLMLCGDLVVGSSPEAVQRLRAGHSFTLLNSDVSPTAAFVSNPNWSLASTDLKDVIQTASGAGRLASIDASNLAVRLLGDAVYANPIMLGFAYQKGWIPLHHQSIERAIELNGVQIDLNLRAFNIGRLAVHDAGAVVPAEVPAVVPAVGGEVPSPEDAFPENPTLEQLVTHRSALLTQYQSKAYAARYADFVTEVAAAEQKATGTDTLACAVASSLFKLMAYKDEYEVARLYSDGEFIRRIEQQFEGDWSLRFYLAPPLLAKRDSQGVLLKKSYGPKMMSAFRFLARLKFLRGTALDPFGYTAERRHERELIVRYQAAIRAILPTLPTLAESSQADALALAKIPEGIRGFGHVKAQAMHQALETFERVSRGASNTGPGRRSSPSLDVT